MYVHVLYNKIHLLKNLRMKQPVQVNPGLNCSFSYENCIYIYIYNTIHMYSEITSGRVLNGELSYTKILEVNLFAFAYRLFRRDFSPLDGTYCMGTHSFLQLYMYFVYIYGMKYAI